MHRGGTSALAGTLARLGLASPRTPLPASDDNPRGFYESQPVVLLNHYTLLAAGCAWNVCLTFDPEWLDGILQPYRPVILNTLRTEFGEHGSFVLKDPRLCLTFPGWLPALRALGAEVRVLIVVRHPAEVVQSLAARNQLLERDTAPHWLYHMLQAEWASRGLPRAVVVYDDLMRDWRTCLRQASEAACIAWPRSAEAAGPEIDAFLVQALRNHAAGSASAYVGPEPVSDMVGVAWLALRHMAEKPEAPAALDCLDQLRSRFAEWRRAAFPNGVRAIFTDP
jgi:hypothetical protein